MDLFMKICIEMGDSDSDNTLHTHAEQEYKRVMKAKYE